MADCRRKAIRTVCIHGLDGVESEKQSSTKFTSYPASSGGRTGEGNVGTISCKLASS